MMNRSIVLISVVVSFVLAPLAASAQAQGFATLAPPAPIVERPPPSPGANYAWVSGFWSWSGTQFTWTAGRWEQPPAPAQMWEAPQWEREGQRYRFRPGRWHPRDGMPHPVQAPVVVAQPAPPPVVVSPMGVVVVPQPPPRMRAERRPGVAQPGQRWVPGYWAWNGAQHIWNPGQWQAPPRPESRWVAPRWGRQGRGWAMHPGRWR